MVHKTLCVLLIRNTPRRYGHGYLNTFSLLDTIDAVPSNYSSHKSYRNRTILGKRHNLCSVGFF